MAIQGQTDGPHVWMHPSVCTHVFTNSNKTNKSTQPHRTSKTHLQEHQKDTGVPLAPAYGRANVCSLGDNPLVTSGRKLTCICCEVM